MPVLAATATYSSYYNVQNATYATGHDAANAGLMGGPNIALFGQDFAASLYEIYRGGLFFNTSTIPSDAALMSATLSLYVYGDTSVTDFDITIINGSALSNPRASADYGGLLAATASGGTLTTSGLSLNNYNDITANTTGLGFITKAGTTKLALRSSRDINSNVPTGYEWIRIYGQDATNPAKLTIYYARKGNLFLKAENLHYVSYTGVERYNLGTPV